MRALRDAILLGAHTPDPTDPRDGDRAEAARPAMATTTSDPSSICLFASRSQAVVIVDSCE